MCTEKLQETAQNLRIIDDALFRLIAGDKEVCQEILRVLLDDEDLIVLQAETQVNISSLHREVTLDVLCKIAGKYVNVEVQKGKGNDDIRRTRFHLSTITDNETSKGTDFRQVPDVTVIYITEYDALENGQVFTVSEMCMKTKDGYVPVHDGARICYANTAVKDDSVKSELLQLFLEKAAFDDIRFPKLSDKIQYFKNTEKGRGEMCTLVEDYAKEYAEEYAKEYAEEYAKETLKETARKLLQKGISITDVIESTGLSEEDILAIKEETVLDK